MWHCVPKRMVGLEASWRIAKCFLLSYPLLGCPQGLEMMLFTNCNQMRVAPRGYNVLHMAASACTFGNLLPIKGSRSRMRYNGSNKFKRQWWTFTLKLQGQNLLCQIQNITCQLQRSPTSRELRTQAGKEENLGVVGGVL